MKVALIGNMNNNNFAIMRYMRDLGVHADLFPYANDGKNSLSHFKPECDTWHIEKWRDNIYDFEVENSMWSLHFNPKTLETPVSRDYVKETFREYDYIIGSGLAPAILERAGLRLDIFYPYATGVEFIGAVDFKSYNFKKWDVVRRGIWSMTKEKQKQGIKQAKYCLNAEMGDSKRAIEELGQENIPLAIPMIYNREHPDESKMSQHLLTVRDKMSTHDFCIISHARQMWKNTYGYTDKEWALANKNNNWVIEGFAEFKAKAGGNPLLVLLEYGPDVDASKALCKELNLEQNVYWAGKMQRKEIMALMDVCDAGVGEFTIHDGVIWGGTGWEVLAAGKPLLQTLNFTPESFEEQFGHPPPPLLDVKSKQDVARYLEELYLNKENCAEIGKNSLKWFDTNNGIGLAKKWLEYLN